MLLSSHRRCSARKDVLEILQNSQENTCESLAKEFSCEFCKISKNTFFTEYSLLGGCFCFIFLKYEELVYFLFRVYNGNNYIQKAFNILVQYLILCRVFFRLIKFNWKSTLQWKLLPSLNELCLCGRRDPCIKRTWCYLLTRVFLITNSLNVGISFE